MPDPLADVTAEELYGEGVALAQGGDPHRAEQYLVASMEKGKPREVVVPVLAQLCISMGRYSAALRYVEPVLADRPMDWQLRRLAASLYHGLERIEEARQEYLRVLVAAPDDPMTHYFLGMFYLEDLNDRDQAGRLLGRYVALAPSGEHADQVRDLLGREEALDGVERIERIDAADVPPPNSPTDSPTESPESQGTEPDHTTEDQGSEP